ncbi:hypothetical protein DFS33DRAFT_971834 [Desarmillaria ectypa]|nr:hypothetical protein DFS33DRAFT_971834 [Desarmillaria ectypa]
MPFPCIGATLGAIYVGATVAAVFYGITILQTAIYYKHNPNDPWLFRYTVALLLILDTLHVALSTHALYFYLIESFGNYLALLKIIWSFPLQLVLNMVVACCVQALYAVRIWKRLYSRSSFSRGLAMVHFPCCRSYVRHWTLCDLRHIHPPEFCRHFDYESIHICGLLHDGGSRFHHFRTTKTIMTLMRVVVISGLLTSACSLITLIAYVIWPDTLIFIATGSFILPKLYINSLLAMLNSRKSSMWSVGRERHIDQKIIRFAPHDAESGVVDSGQTNITIPGLSVTGVETNISIPLPVTVTDSEGSNSSSMGNMAFA